MIKKCIPVKTFETRFQLSHIKYSTSNYIRNDEKSSDKHVNAAYRSRARIPGGDTVSECSVMPRTLGSITLLKAL